MTVDISTMQPVADLLFEADDIERSVINAMGAGVPRHRLWGYEILIGTKLVITAAIHDNPQAALKMLDQHMWRVLRGAQCRCIDTTKYQALRQHVEQMGLSRLNAEDSLALSCAWDTIRHSVVT